MSEFSLTLVMQFQTSKIIHDMAKISIKCELSKNANLFVTIPIVKGIAVAKGSHFFSYIVSIIIMFSVWIQSIIELKSRHCLATCQRTTTATGM